LNYSFFNAIIYYENGGSMSLTQKFKENKRKPIFITASMGDYGDVEFMVSSITLGDILNHTDKYPSLHSVMNGINLDDTEDDPQLRAKKFLELLDAFNIIVALGVKYKDGDEWVSFSAEPGEDVVTPGEVLSQQILIELGSTVIKNFRTVR
jgi:hypothetical protein